MYRKVIGISSTYFSERQAKKRNICSAFPIDHFYEQLRAVRRQKHYSQEWLAEQLGVSARYIRSCEKGTSVPTIEETRKAFEALGVNPLRAYLNYLYPQIYNTLTPDSSDEEVRQALVTYITDVAGSTEIRQLLYLIAGEHGSSWPAFLQMMVAHLHTPLQARTNVALMIHLNMETALALGTTVCPEYVMPEMSILDNAIQNSIQAVYNHQSGYTSSKV